MHLVNAEIAEVGTNPREWYASPFHHRRENELSIAWYIVLEREIPGFDHAVNGKAVARAGDQLDSLADEKGLPTLMSFFSISPEELAGFADDHGVSLKKPASEKWFSADDGLKTLDGLIDAAEER